MSPFVHMMISTSHPKTHPIPDIPSPISFKLVLLFTVLLPMESCPSKINFGPNNNQKEDYRFDIRTHLLGLRPYVLLLWHDPVLVCLQTPSRPWEAVER